MTLIVWVDDWQMRCCGKTFASGDTVSWNLLEVDPEDYADVVGDERAIGINFREEHHGQEGKQTPALLEILTITEVHCRYAASPDSTTNVQGPVPGTTELVPVSEANGWAENRPDVSFVGYLVTARPAKTEV